MADRIGAAIRLALLALIRFYQAAISPYLPGACRFHPTCSHYAAEAIHLHGALRGSALAALRLARCHPFHPGGHDPVPLPRNKERMMPSTVRTTLTSVLLALTILSWSPSAAATCGDDEPGRAEWTFAEEGTPLYRAVFTARAGTLACFELLNPQYARPEPLTMPTGVPEWMSGVGPMNIVTTWDTEFLPFTLSFLTLAEGHEVTRVVKDPTTTARREGFKPGESRTGKPLELYKADPTYTLVSTSDAEIVYVWPDPTADKSDFFIEKRYGRVGGFSISLAVTIYNFSTTDVATQPQIEVNVWEASRAKGGMFSPPPNVAEGLCLTGDSDLERQDGSDLVGKTVNPPGESRWTGIDDRYFIRAVIARGLTEARCTLAAGTNGVITAYMYRANPFVVAPPQGASCHPPWYKPAEKLLRCDDIATRLGITSAELFVAASAERAFTHKKESFGQQESDETLTVLKNLGASRGAVLYQYEFYLGPKDIDRLKEPGVGLEDSLNFWVLGFISKPMLYLLRWFYSLIPHWAVAIMLLTVLVKLALLYWTQKSYAQMQRMASLKPMMEEIKKKYSKDKERLNQEMMNLYKREKVNPVGGCLPMLLQMPIWIALYRTIYSAVDLYQAPLGLWITDLSAPDPYFVLPLVLGASMFLQQKLTPTTMDSAQAKMMLYIMPIMFTVFMLFLPSGLNLYILINTVLSLGQQYYLKKKLSTPPILKAA